jgi:hypothetical protein
MGREPKAKPLRDDEQFVCCAREKDTDDLLDEIEEEEDEE